MNPKSIQKASWSPSWANAAKKPDFEPPKKKPRGSQKRPEEFQDRPKPVPSKGQDRPKFNFCVNFRLVFSNPIISLIVSDIFLEIYMFS